MSQNRPHAPQRPNIVLIVADDLGFSDLGCYGGEIRTPNLDGLARQGMRFTHFYNNAVCVATRASLLTGVYAHQVGTERLGNRLQAGRNNVTFAEILRDAGYRTLMAGKWHNGNADGERPCDRGFDRYWGLLAGCSNYFNPGDPRPGEPAPVHKSTPREYRPWGDDNRVIFPFTPTDPNFYSTDAFTRHALEFLDRYGTEDRPFLLYLAHAAPHFPLQAWPGDIARYQGTYREGWDAVRRHRHRRLLDMGLIEPQWLLSDRDDVCPRWEDADNQPRWDRRMAVYAAMIDRMDQGIGQVLTKIRDLGKTENTLVLFLSDNGGCATQIDNTPDKDPGAVDTYTTVGPPWANASNTPFRKYKIFDHEGGIATPLIACWPRVITPGGITHEIGHVMDFLPTFADLARTAYPSTRGGNPILPCEGQSLVPLFHGADREGHHALFWEMKQCRAVRRGKWKAVSLGPERVHGTLPIPPGHEGWELYDMDQDRCECHDLADRHPALVKELDGLWQAWFDRCQRDNAASPR